MTLMFYAVAIQSIHALCALLSNRDKLGIISTVKRHHEISDKWAMHCFNGQSLSFWGGWGVYQKWSFVSFFWQCQTFDLVPYIDKAWKHANVSHKRAAHISRCICESVSQLFSSYYHFFSTWMPCSGGVTFYWMERTIEKSVHHGINVYIICLTCIRNRLCGFCNVAMPVIMGAIINYHQGGY